MTHRPGTGGRTRQVHGGHRVQHHEHQIVLGQPLPHVHRQQQRLITLREREFCGTCHDLKHPAYPAEGVPFMRQAETYGQPLTRWIITAPTTGYGRFLIAKAVFVAVAAVLALASLVRLRHPAEPGAGLPLRPGWRSARWPWCWS